ncbi:hypothetical protein M2171_005262 [Bradyrhizobium japonicum USDA 38]|nr:hypothetical protein [Bradyrhizobium japonicum USDA 38]MCS3948643.1 hypothetical protein [Bradyrhizobium japonicum]MCW2218624.1 hypothetical protein [Bradyrhizobium japonicum]MCW2343238.1 hypothetical protein [Bradyrhizobium japonicum]
MSNILAFPIGGLPPSNIRELRNPSYQLPTENVVEPTRGG